MGCLSDSEEDCDGRKEHHGRKCDTEEGQETTTYCCCCTFSKDFKRQGCLKRMGRNILRRLGLWLLEIEMGFVWGVAGLSIIVFVFAAIWYIDPALLTLVLQFRQAECTTVDAAFLVGISNCSWTSCRLGCTREVYQCWQIQVTYEYLSGSVPYRPPWSSLSSFASTGLQTSRKTDSKFVETGISSAHNLARLYPNVRGCGYPPDLNCEDFFEKFGGPKNASIGSSQLPFTCWVSTIDSSIAMTELDLERAKEEVILSLIPLFIFIVFVLYAFCRLGVFAVCNPLKVCPRSADDTVNVPALTPKKLIAYKRGMVLKKAAALAAFQQVSTNDDDDEMYIQNAAGLPTTIEEDEDLAGGAGESNGTAGNSGGSHQLLTLAEVLPVREPVESSGVRARTSREESLSLAESAAGSAVERFRRKRRKPFLAFGETNSDDAFDDDFDTNTVINDLFGEELEMMDKERLVARYDVLNLEDIGIDYDEDKLLALAAAGDSATSETRLTSPPATGTKTTSFNVASLRKKSNASNFSTWDDFDAGSSFDGSSERSRKPRTRSSASSSVAGPSSGKRKSAVNLAKDEFD